MVRLYKKIKESEEKYKDLLETSTIGILEIELENNSVSYINPKLLEGLIRNINNWYFRNRTGK